MVSEEIKAAQAEYAARPFEVRWVDSHCAMTSRFNTLDQAFTYIQRCWKDVQATVRQCPHCSSDLRASYLRTPTGGKVALRYVLLCDDVSSY